MLEDYCLKLQLLQKQKQNFLKLKYKTNTIQKIHQQENKYHKYILAQIAYKNRLDALLKLTLTLTSPLTKLQRSFLDLLQKKNHFRDSQAEKSISKSHGSDVTQSHSESDSEKIIALSTHPLKLKLKHTASTLIQKWIKNYNKNNLRFSLKEIEKKSFKIYKIQNIEKMLQKKKLFQKNVFFQALKTLKPKQNKKIEHETRESRSFIFSLNEFSQIIPYTIEEESNELSTSRIKNIEEIDSKFSPLSESQILSPKNVSKTQADHKLMLESFEKLRDEVLLMKNLLCQKNKQLKSKEQQIYKLKREYENKIQNLHDEISSKIQKEYMARESSMLKFSKRQNSKYEEGNESYLKQLQRQVIGDRACGGNQFEEEEVGQQLIQKYMKESFEMREKMDMAREMCEQFEFDSRTDEGQIMIEIIKLLTPEERLNACID